ncbi:MAG TPA: acyl-CoA dehydrogenase family protein [Dermatophilaceae bacterium]
MATKTAQAPLDLYGIDALIDEDDRAMRDTVRAVMDDMVRPHIAQWYESGTVPARELAKELGGLGLLGMHLQGYGCAGTSATAYGLACLELEAADSGIRSLVSVQGSLAMFAIWKHGSEEQKQQWLPPMAAGDAIGCFGLTESDFGSDPAGMRTRARRDGSDWVLDGTKMWITNGSIADVAVVWAQTDDGIRGFVVPTDTPGFSAPKIGNKMSLRASVTSELVLSGVRLPGSAMLPNVRGLGGPLSCLNEARFGILFGALGAARDCLSTTIAYTQDRQIFDKPLAAYQATQLKLADMTVALGNGMLLALHLGRLKDAHQLRPEQVSLGKLNNVRESIAIARQCRTLLGASGITLEYPIMRHANNLESVLTYEGTSEVHQMIIGQAVTGHSSFRG